MMHARQHQARYENRIAELDALIKNADVVDEIEFTGVVDYGTDVYMHNTDDGTKRWVRIVGEMESTNKSEISFTSPFGRALLGHVAGDEVEIRIPSGTQNWEILEVKVSNGFAKLPKREQTE